MTSIFSSKQVDESTLLLWKDQALTDCLTDLSGQPPGLPVGFGLVHSLCDLLEQLVQLDGGLHQDGAELLPGVLQVEEKKREPSQPLPEVN